MGCIQSSDAKQHLPDTFLRNLCTHHQDVDVFSQYRVVKEIGHGAFGVVNLVEHISTTDQYAMKVSSARQKPQVHISIGYYNRS
jgi:serine/threonine protein kinase